MNELSLSSMHGFYPPKDKVENSVYFH